MGAVYQATDERIGGRLLAIKEMSDAALTDPAEKEMATAKFRQEAELLAKLDHPNIPGVMDYFTEAGKHFLVMDFIDGKTLEQLVAEIGGPLDVKQVVEWSRQLCDVLGYLHSQNPPVIFRDLKPENANVESHWSDQAD
jgi:serine/threonine-protein kinase